VKEIYAGKVRKMNVPRLRKINDASVESRVKVEEVIQERLKNEAVFTCCPIEEFNFEELDLLAEYAKENGMIMFLKAEYSNFHQGVLVKLISKEKIARYTDCL